MIYQQLEKIAKKYITEESTEFPADAFKLAKQLDLRVKNSIECKQDFKDQYPLYKCNAAYTLVNGEYTIYHDEKYAYKNFSVAHEIAHHLLEHCSDGVKEHHDANLLAAILLLSPENIVKNKIKHAVELSLKCLIPYNVACEYWADLNMADIVEEGTPEDMGLLFEIGERLREICDTISKGAAVAGMASKAMENIHQKGTTFTGNEILNTFNAIYDYVSKANGLSSELYEKYQKMYIKK